MRILSFLAGKLKTFWTAVTVAVTSAKHLHKSHGKINKHNNETIFNIGNIYKVGKRKFQKNQRIPYFWNLVLQNKYSRKTNTRTRCNMSNPNQNFKKTKHEIVSAYIKTKLFELHDDLVDKVYRLDKQQIITC